MTAKHEKYDAIALHGKTLVSEVGSAVYEYLKSQPKKLDCFLAAVYASQKPHYGCTFMAMNITPTVCAVLEYLTELERDGVLTLGDMKTETVPVIISAILRHTNWDHSHSSGKSFNLCKIPHHVYMIQITDLAATRCREQQKKAALTAPDHYPQFADYKAAFSAELARRGATKATTTFLFTRFKKDLAQHWLNAVKPSIAADSIVSVYSV